MVTSLPAHQNPGVSEEILGIEKMQYIYSKTELPERRVSFLEACSECKRQVGTTEACPRGHMPFSFSSAQIPTSSQPPSVLRNSGGPFFSLISPMLSSFLEAFFLPSSPNILYILSKTNCFLDFLQIKASLTTWYVQRLWQRQPVLRRCYLQSRVQLVWLRTPKCGWEVSSSINAHFTLPLAWSFS